MLSLHIIMYFRRDSSLPSVIMLKFVVVILFIFQFGCGFEIFELQEFGSRVRNLSLELFKFTERDAKTPVVMAPYTIWNLISLVAFTTSADSWKQFHTIIGFPKRNEQYINSLYKSITNSLLRNSVGASFETKLVVFYDADIELSQPFKRSILRSGALLRMLYFDDVLASEFANDNMRLPGDLRLKRTVFNKADFEDASVIVSGIVEFKGDWSLPFEESNTIKRDGYNGSFYMMRQRARVFYDNIETLSASAMLLPYGENRDFSMFIIRPYDNVQLDNVIRNLAKMSLPDIFYELYENGLKEMDIELPKFSLASVLVLNNPFKSIGVRDVFVSEQANFSELSTSEDMYIFNIEHRAIFIVSETGTVAKAFTPANLAKGTRKSKAGMAPPFLFFLVHGPTMTIIFSVPRKRGFVIRAAMLSLIFSSLLLGWRLATVCGRALLVPASGVQLDHFRINRNLKDYLDKINVLVEPSSIVCPNVSKSPLLVLVTSSPYRFEHREAIRSTWGRYFQTYFIMGLNGSTVEDLLVDNYVEAQMYNDIIIYKFQDHYQNLTLKTALMIKWTLSRCSNEVMLFKTDDDVLVNPWMMEKVVKQHRKKDLIGFKVTDVRLHRDAYNKWYVPRWLMYRDHVEEYLSGTGYIINGQHLKSILAKASKVPLINLEDVYFTYLVSKCKLGLTLTHDRRLSPFKPWLPGACMYFGLASVHSLTPPQMLRAWPGIKTLGEEYHDVENVCDFNKIFWSDMFLY